MVAVCTARTIARSIASSVCKKPLALSLASAAPTDIDQLLLDGTNAAHYTTAEWAGFEHLLKDQKTDIGTLRVPRGQRCYAPDGVDDYIAVASLTGSETVVSSSGTSTPSIAAGRINFTAGTVWDITLSNGSQYLCNEESGSTAYDIGDNAAHGTITNATLASFHSTSASVLTNRNNDVGYRLSGSVYIPATSSTLAADGNALTHTGKCPQPGYAPQKCVKGDGTSVVVATQSINIGTSDFTITFWAKGTALAPRIAVYTSTFAIYFLGSAAISVYDYTTAGVVLTGNWENTSWHKVQVSRASGHISIAVDGVVNATNTSTSNFGTNTIQFFGFGGQCWDGQISNASLSVGGVTYYWPLCEGPGSGNTNRDIHYLKSDNTSGVLASAIVNGTVSTIWANATDYTSGVFNWPLRYGYTVNGSGVVVPALLSGATDAAGNAIGQAAGGWASGLQNINCLPYTNPLGVNIGLETSLDPTADRKTTSSSKRRRRNTSGRYDRIGARATAMSDASSNAYFGD